MLLDNVDVTHMLKHACVASGLNGLNAASGLNGLSSVYITRIYDYDIVHVCKDQCVTLLCQTPFFFLLLVFQSRSHQELDALPARLYMLANTRSLVYCVSVSL